jgi:hypothetical protein
MLTSTFTASLSLSTMRTLRPVSGAVSFIVLDFLD